METLVSLWLRARPHPTHEADAEMWLSGIGARTQLREAIRKVLMQLWLEAWEAGQKVAGGEVHPQVAADRINRMSAKWLDEVTETRLKRIAVILAAGGTAAALAAAITAMLTSSADAGMVAITEVTRAMNAAAMEAYRKGNVDRVRWVTRSANPCPICLENEAAGPKHLGEPFPNGDTAPPVHPNCECVLIPADGE